MCLAIPGSTLPSPLPAIAKDCQAGSSVNIKSACANPLAGSPAIGALTCTLSPDFLMSVLATPAANSICTSVSLSVVLASTCRSKSPDVAFLPVLPNQVVVGNGSPETFSSQATVAGMSSRLMRCVKGCLSAPLNMFPPSSIIIFGNW